MMHHYVSTVPQEKPNTERHFCIGSPTYLKERSDRVAICHFSVRCFTYWSFKCFHLQNMTKYTYCICKAKRAKEGKRESEEERQKKREVKVIERKKRKEKLGRQRTEMKTKKGKRFSAVMVAEGVKSG